MENQWFVHKFGGTSLSNAECMRKCIDIIKPTTKRHRIAVVVSAMGGKPKVTDMLLDLVNFAARGMSSEIVTTIAAIKDKHSTCVNDILSTTPTIASRILELIDSDLKDIGDLLKAVQLMRTAHPQILELVSGYGEVWSATIMVEAMRLAGLPFVLLNARDVLFVSEHDSLGTKVHWNESQIKLDTFIQNVNNADKLNSVSLINTHAQALTHTHLLITGYIASTLEGVATTLKRDGSDFSASIFGKLLNAVAITIWTDVSGVYSADPNRVPDAQIISEVSYTEAIELAYFGAKVIHPKTMAPAISANIPIFIRNTFKPECDGTRIFLTPTVTDGQQVIRERSVCGFTTVDGLCLMNIEGTGMIGVPGIAHRLFGALKTANISVMFIAQASSEHSICFATKSISSQQAREAVEEAFFYELKQGFITNIREIHECSIIAAVGESMNNMPGVAGLFFSALGNASINVLSISQGCDERNISAVVYTKDATKALRAVHSAFWLSSLDLNIGIVGTGRVGSALIQILLEQSEILGKRFGLDIKLKGVANSRKMLLGEDISESLRGKLTFFKPHISPIPATAHGVGSVLSEKSGGYSTEESETSLSPMQCFNSPSKQPSVRTNRESFSTLDLVAIQNIIVEEQKDTDMRKTRSNSSLSDMQAAMNSLAGGDDTKIDTDLTVFMKHLQSGGTPHSIIIDTSTSNEVAALHPSWLRAGVHVVTANKRAVSASLELYDSVFSAARKAKRLYMSEVTIGASLPIRTTLNDILCSGDAIHSIVGIMSVSVGTVITYMCDENLTFTQAVAKTYAQGLFEDDIFTDLEGTDAAEKLLILARELGVAMRMEDIIVEPMAVTRDIGNWDQLTDEFKEEDVTIASRIAAAASRGCVLRYIQRIECNPPAELGNHHLVKATATVKLEEVPRESNHALVKGAVYHFSFHTERYAQNPLIIQGPLSDSVNTASGIIGDIIRVARSIGAKDRGPEALLHGKVQ